MHNTIESLVRAKAIEAVSETLGAERPKAPAGRANYPSPREKAAQRTEVLRFVQSNPGTQRVAMLFALSLSPGQLTSRLNALRASEQIVMRGTRGAARYYPCVPEQAA